MRKILMVLLTLFIGSISFAQVNVTLQQPPQNQLKATDLWKAILVNTTPSILHITISGTLTEKVEGVVVNGKSRLISLPPGTKIITYNDVNTGTVNFKSGSWSQAFNQTGVAPSGDYTICISIKAEDGREIGSNCIDKTITGVIPIEETPRLTLKLIPPPLNQLKSSDLWRTIVINAGAAAYKASLVSVELKEKTLGLVAESKLRMVSISGSKNFSFNDFKSGEMIYRNAKLETAFNKGLNAPDGNYTICIYIKNEKGIEIARDCIDHTILNIVQQEIKPQLISPANSALQNFNMPLLFTWMLPTIKAGNDFSYKLKMVEIIGSQSPDAAINANLAWLEKTDIKTTMLQYPLTAKKIEKGKKYAWQVQLVNNTDPSGSSNSGKSETYVFEVEGENGTTKSLVTPAPSDTVSATTGTVASGDTIKAGLNGEFKVIVFESNAETDGSLTGKGKVYIKWLMTNVAVEFKKIKVDTTKRLISGGIVSSQGGSTSTSWQNYPKAWALSLLSGPGGTAVTDYLMEWTNNQVENIVDWTINQAAGYPIMNYQSNIPAPPIPDNSLKMPFGLQFNNGNQKLVITEMIFKPNESKINFLAQQKFMKSGTQYTLGFVAKYFKIHPARIEFSNGRVELVEDVKIPNTVSNPKMKFIFKKGTSNSGCYVEWDSTGVKDIGLALDVKFSQDWLKRTTAPLTDSVKATIAGNGTSMTDILLTGTIDSCEIVGTNGIKIKTSPLFLDLSETRNPLNMNFPKNYPNDSTITWKGFYVKSFVLNLPDTWKTGTNLTAPVVSAKNFIIDDFGITTKIKAVDVFNLQNGRIADLSASLDTVDISIISSSLVSGKAKGILVLPISEVTVQNSLKYTATFNQVSGNNNFQIAILPVGPIDADILKGKLTLLPTSSISANLSPNSNSLAINLNGTFNWDSPNFTIKGIKMELGFENVGLNYSFNSTTNALSFNPGSWSFASPPKWLANFPVSIKKVYYKSLATASLPSPNMELLRGALMIDIVANLTEDIGGTTTLGASFAVELNKSSRKFTPKFKEVFLDSISVHAAMPAVKIDGNISIRNEDPIFGNGFLGELNVEFTSVSLKARALVEFGNTNYQYSSLYRYWRVEADILLPPPGVPFLPGIAFRGFGGGAYYNMLATQGTSSKTPSGKKFTFTPLKSTMGLRVAATIATTPKEETFNADVGLLAQFSKSQGLTLIAFTGDFWVGAGFAKRPKANISGAVNVSYDFPNKHFNLSASVNVDAPPIKTPSPANLVLDIKGKTNKWFFKFGEPVPNGLNKVDVFGVHLYEYLMFGNDIVAPTGFTQTFKDGYHGVFGEYPGAPTTIGVTGNTNTATGRGFALGIGFEFKKDVDFNLIGSYQAQLKLAAGAELNLAFSEFLGNNCENPSELIGINGWQAAGSIGFYASVNALVKKGSSTWNIAEIKAGGWLQGKFPNPVYVIGQVQGLVKIGGITTGVHTLGCCSVCGKGLGDNCGDYLLHKNGCGHKFKHQWCPHLQTTYLVNTSFNRDFEYGTDCSGITSAGNGAAVEEGDAAEDQKQLLIQYVHPLQQYSFPILSPLAVKFGLIPNNVFDVNEQQADGSIKNRTFKMVITTNLKIKNADGMLTNVTLKKNENNLGEYLYTVASPIIINAATAKQIRNAGVNLNSSGTSIFAGGKLNKTTSFGLNAITTYPLPAPTNTYTNLPVEPPEIKNNLTIDKNYTFTVTATLKEFVANNWVIAKNKNNIPVTQTVVKYFRTGAMVIAAANNSNKTLLKKN